MAFRGGRGRGRGGFGYGRFAKEEKFEVFPEINELPEVNLEEKDKEFKTLVEWSHNLTRYWNSSPYCLEDPSKDGKKNESTIKRPPLSDYMIMSSDCLPAELVGKNVRPIKRKKTQWDLQSDLLKLDIFEKLDQAGQGQDDENKEDEDEDEDLENIEEEEDDEDDDYGKNRDFDDDEDDFNMNEDFGDDEGCY